MPKRNIGRAMEVFVHGLVGETVRGLKHALPSQRQLHRIEQKLSDLERRVGRLARRSGAPSGAGGGKVGRPRQNPLTCTARGCSSAARAKALCSRHYQQRRRQHIRKK
jgi:hypothetical protein